MTEFKNKLCTHYKGARYRIVGFAKHSEDLSDLVIYESETSGEIWARPKEMFFEKVLINEIWVDRFQFDDEA